jgi:hypothetical protein
MSKYVIELSSGRAEGIVKLSGVECNNWESADAFAEAIATLMPSASYYCQKNSCDIETSWCGSAEEQGE